MACFPRAHSLCSVCSLPASFKACWGQWKWMIPFWMLTGERPPYLLGKLSGGCLLMSLLCPALKSSFLYQSDIVIPFSRFPFYPHGFTVLMLRVGAISYAYKEFNFLEFCLSRSWFTPLFSGQSRAVHFLFLPGPRQNRTESFSLGNVCPIQNTGQPISFNHFLMVPTHWVHTDTVRLNGGL